MQPLQGLMQDILVRGRVTSDDLEALRTALYAGGTVSRPMAEAAVELHKRVQHPNPAFEQFFYKVVKDHVLADGRIDADETAWLRTVLSSDGPIKDEERQMLHELKGEAASLSPEFEALFNESMKRPQEARTSK